MTKVSVGPYFSTVKRLCFRNVDGNLEITNSAASKIRVRRKIVYYIHIESENDVYFNHDMETVSSKSLIRFDNFPTEFYLMIRGKSKGIKFTLV